MKRGLFIGRFQPFHSGHLQAIKSSLREVSELVVCIGSSQEKHTVQNPFTVKERIEMIDSVLPANGITKYTIYPIPDRHNDKKWAEHVETLVPKFDIVFTGNEWTGRCFKKKGYKVKKVKIWKGISSTIIRNKMLKNQDWQSLIPKDILAYIKKIKGVQRIKLLRN